MEIAKHGNIKVEQLRPAIEAYFSQARSFADISRNKFAASMGISRSSMYKIFPSGLWGQMQKNWLRSVLKPVMDEIFGDSIVREDFTVGKILKRLEGVKISKELFLQAVGDDWLVLAGRLPTARQLVHDKLKEWKRANEQIETFTSGRLLQETKLKQTYTSWIGDALRVARREHLQQHNPPPPAPDSTVRLFEFSGRWVDLDSDEWDFNPCCERLSRTKLRNDIAALAWPILRGELEARRYAIRTVAGHYRGFRWAGDLLGEAIPDVREAILETTQIAWNKYSAGKSKKNNARSALIKILACLLEKAEIDKSINSGEVSRIITWLVAQSSTPDETPTTDFLSEEELDQVITCCLVDIGAGVKFMESSPDLLRASIIDGNDGSAAPVARWGLALMILLMVFTGLRPGSVTRLKVNEWMQILPKVTALTWQHDKKNEANVVAIPVLLARLLNLYVQHTETLRQALMVNLVFITSDRWVQWRCFKWTNDILVRMQEFVERHKLRRDGKPLHFTPTVLRRTYATQQLYKGRSIWFIRAQFGHKRIISTMHYVQLDRFEHPAQVGTALDDYGQRVLDLWRSPVTTAPLNSASRAALFSPEKGEVGGDALLPCSTCGQLATSPKLWDEWEGENKRRKEHLRGLEENPDPSNLVGRELSDHQQFTANYEFVERSVRGDGRR